MPDFFVNRDSSFWKNKQSQLEQNPTQASQFWAEKSAEYEQKKEQYYEDFNRYGVEVPDEYYDVFNQILNQAESPEAAQEEAYRLGSAVKYSQFYGIPIDEAYKNVDAYNEANFTDLQDQKSRFEALSDMLTLGNNNVKLGNLGQKLMQAHANNDTELVNAYMAEIDAINQRNVLLQDNTPRKWIMQALEAGAQSLPFTGYVAGAGVIGNFIAPGVGTGAAFAASSYLSSGQEYIDMIANGATPQTARIVATVSGGIQGLIEADLGITKGIVKGAAKTMGKEVAEDAAQKALEEIGRKVFKKFHFGAGKKILVNYLKEYGKNVLGEGVEEFLQEITSIVGNEIAASIDGYDIPDDDMKSIVNQTTEAFKGGILGALALGFVPAGLNANATVENYRFIKNEAELVESSEAFYNEVKDNPVFEGMSEASKKEASLEIWERAQARKEEAIELEARAIAETRDAAEGAEEKNVNENGEEETVESVYREESGRLSIQDDEKENTDGSVSGTFLAGDRTKDSNNRYGYINYTADEENKKVTINSFKMTEGREGLRGELFDEFARKYSGYDIEWNAVGNEAKAIKESLIENNPAGSKSGLSYYKDEEVEDIAARKKVAAEVRKNIHNVTVNPDGSYSRTELTAKQTASAVALIEAGAKRMGMSLNDYINKTFNDGQIFGSTEDFDKVATAQNDTTAGKAGGVIQGVAQENWRKFGMQVKAVIYAGENADFSTWAHELAHIYQAQLDGDLKAEAEKAFNVVNEDWINSKYTFADGHVDSAAEAFAYGFQDWLKTGKAENEEMKNIFQRFAEFLARAYNALKKHINFTPEIESVYNQLLSGDDSLLALAEKAVEEENKGYKAGLKKQAEEKEAQRKTAAEEEKKLKAAEREEASELTDFAEEETEPETIENTLDTQEEADEGNAQIDDAVENLNLTDEEKNDVVETLTDEDATLTDKMETATEAAGSVYEEAGVPYALFQIAGEIGAQNLDDAETQEGVSRMQNLAIAKQMEADGKDAQAIRLATGWEKGSDGKWRWEIDDSKIKTDFIDKSIRFIKDNPRYEEIHDKLKSNNYDFEKLSKDEQEEYDKLTDEKNKNYYKTGTTLEEIIDYPELFKAYPELKRFPILFSEKNISEIWGARTHIAEDGKPNIIEFNGKPNDYNNELYKSILLHEIQHVIQHIEGFAVGGNPADFENSVIDDLIEEQNKAKIKLIEISKNAIKRPYFPLSKEEEQKVLENREYGKAYDYWKSQLEGLEIAEKHNRENGYLSKLERYRKVAGEVEARNVQFRREFSPELRLETLLTATEDVAPKDKIILFQEVYHGTSADFDKFDTEQYGLSGEGSMSFGYGTYLTGDKEIARDYARRQYLQKYGTETREAQLNNEKDNLASLEEEVKEYESKEVYEAKTQQLQKDLENANTPWRKKVLTFALNKRSDEYRLNNLSDIQKRIAESKEKIETLKNEIADIKENSKDAKRHLYTVEIPDNGYIVWDKTVPKAKRMAIMDKLYKKLIKEDYAGAESELRRELIPVFETPVNGKELYQNIWTYLGGDKEASLFLSSIGFSGIDFPAGSNFGTPDGKDARNYVIFNDEDAKIVDHLLFQTMEELIDDAKTFDSWQDFMEAYDTFERPLPSPIPFEADAQWYQSTWEMAKGMQTEQEKNEQAVAKKVEQEGTVPGAVDALFASYMRNNPEMLDDFLHEVAQLDAIDLNDEEWRTVEDESQAKERERIDQLKDFISITLSDYNWQSAMKRIQGGGEISEGMRKRLLGEIVDGMKVRDFRALYAEVMEDPQYAVEENDTVAAELSRKLSKYSKRYHDILKPNEDVARVSPERRKRIAEEMANRDIAAKIKNGSLKLDDELDNYIKSLTNQIKDKQAEYDNLEKETKADYQRIADAERRRLLKLHEELLLARGKLKTKNAEVERKIKKGLKITEKYKRESQNLTASYDELFRKFNDLKNSIQITAEVQAALDRQEQVAGLKDDLNGKQKEKSLANEVKKMRIQLVKRTMRRVPFNRIDYNNAKTVIAIQRMLEPNLLGGVNRFIGIDSAFLRGVVSQIITDSDYKEKILRYLDKTEKKSQAFADFKKKLTELKSIKDFDSWTAKERKYAIKVLPKENWVRELNLEQLAKEREESIDLDIGMKEKKVARLDPKTGEVMTDKEGNTITQTAYGLDYSDEIGRLVQDAVGADMFNRIVNQPFSEWTTEDLEELAQRIDELYTEGRELLAAKNEARKKEAERIRKRIEDAIKETGIVINDDDTPEERERKQKEIDKILGLNDTGLKGTEAGKTKGLKSKLNRLIHSYNDLNVLRFARILDGQSEGENVQMLYRREDECFNAKQRSISGRTATVHEIMKANNITEGDLAKNIRVNGLDTEFTVDELLYFLAADKDFVEDEAKLLKGFVGIDANDDWAPTSRNAVMFGNMMSSNRDQEAKEAYDALDRQMKEAIEKGELTVEQQQELSVGALDKTPGTTAYINRCHAAWETVIARANSFLEENPEYKALMEAIEADYAAQYERMNEVSINEFNAPVHRVRAYVPLVRRESNGDTNANQVKEDLLGAFGAESGKQWVNKGMTQRRQQIAPLHQKPVQTGLFLTWASSIERTEHFIAYAPYVRQLNAIYKSRDAGYTRRFIEARYGKSAVKYLDDYINEVANPNAGKVRERGAEWLHVLRGRTAPAYLGWKFSAIIKQGLTSPWPYMQFVNPAEYAAAAFDCCKKGTYDAIKEKSAFMASRVMDPVNELVDEMADNAKNKFDRAWSNFSKKGMAGLEWIDWTCVAPGWLACYKKEYNRLQRMSQARYETKLAELKEANMMADISTSEYLNPEQLEARARQELMDDIELEAVRYADDCTRQCQPSSRVTDLAPLFKNSSEAMKAFLQFQTSLNVIWQNIRYDMPYAARQKQFNRIAGTVMGYVFAGIFMNSVMDGVTGDDDDDKDMQALRNLVYYSTTQFTDAIPMIGSEITNTMDQLITGKRGFAQSGTDMTPSATKLLSALNKVQSGDWQKAATLTAEGIGLYMGAPVSGIKEINKLLGKPWSEGDINLLRGVSDVYGLADDIIEE